MNAVITFMTLAQIAAAGGKITKVRWLGGPLFDQKTKRVRKGYTLSYMLAEVQGHEVRVYDAPEGLTAFKNNWKHELIEWARERNVYGVGVGLTKDEVQDFVW
jgi:hypothetical protein